MCFYPEKRHTEGKSHGSGNIRKYGGRRRGMVSETDFRWMGRTSSQVSQEMRATGLLLKTKKLTGEGNASV